MAKDYNLDTMHPFRLKRVHFCFWKAIVFCLILNTTADLGCSCIRITKTFITMEYDKLRFYRCIADMQVSATSYLHLPTIICTAQIKLLLV